MANSSSASLLTRLLGDLRSVNICGKRTSSTNLKQLPFFLQVTRESLLAAQVNQVYGMVQLKQKPA